jgi:hypothetical protein
LDLLSLLLAAIVAAVPPAWVFEVSVGALVCFARGVVEATRLLNQEAAAAAARVVGLGHPHMAGERDVRFGLIVLGRVELWTSRGCERVEIRRDAEGSQSVTGGESKLEMFRKAVQVM